MTFVSSLLAVSSVIPARSKKPIVTGTAGQIKVDLGTICEALRKLDINLRAYPAECGHVGCALNIHSAASTLESAVKHCAYNAQEIASLDTTDAIAIFDTISKLQPIIIATLHLAIEKKPVFDGVMFGGGSAIVKTDLEKFQANTAKLEDALIDIAPPSLLADARSIKRRIDEAFDEALSVYAIGT